MQALLVYILFDFDVMNVHSGTYFPSFALGLSEERLQKPLGHGK